MRIQRPKQTQKLALREEKKGRKKEEKFHNLTINMSVRSS